MKKFNMVMMASCAMASALISAPLLASGSGGGGYSGGGYSGGNIGGGGLESRPVDSATRAYNKGKKMFAKRITCKKCSYKSGVTDSKTANEVAKKVKAGEFGLKANEQSAVLQYISQRYSIRT